MADEVTLPSKEEIAALPRWARVAFAARCARRVLPLFKYYWPDAPLKHLVAVNSAVEVAERSACLTEQADLVLSANVDTTAVAATNSTAAVTAYSVMYALRAANTADAHHISDAVAHAVARAYAAGAALGKYFVPDAIRQDHQRVVNVAVTDNWTDDTPVPPWVFGPMWPNGVPEGWPAAEPEERLQVTVGVPEDAKPEQTIGYLNRLHALLNNLNIQNGGAGVTIDTVRREQLKEAPVPVGGGS